MATRADWVLDLIVRPGRGGAGNVRTWGRCSDGWPAGGTGSRASRLPALVLAHVSPRATLRSSRAQGSAVVSYAVSWSIAQVDHLQRATVGPGANPTCLETVRRHGHIAGMSPHRRIHAAAVLALHIVGPHFAYAFPPPSQFKHPVPQRVLVGTPVTPAVGRYALPTLPGHPRPSAACGRTTTLRRFRPEGRVVAWRALLHPAAFSSWASGFFVPGVQLVWVRGSTRNWSLLPTGPRVVS